MRLHVSTAIACACLASVACGSKLTMSDAGAGGAGGHATGGNPGTGGLATGGSTGTGGMIDSHDASVDAVGGLPCSALASPTDTPPPTPPAPGCPCTRAPGHGNSYLCPMGIGQTVYASIGPEGGAISLLGQEGARSNVPFGINVPPGALASTTLISVTETSLPPPTGILDWSPVYLVEPRGLQLRRVAALQIAWSSNVSIVPKTLAIYSRDEKGSCGFKPLVDSHTNAGFEQASLTEFGYLLVGAPSTVDPSTCTGVDAAPTDDAPSTDAGAAGTDAAGG